MSGFGLILSLVSFFSAVWALWMVWRVREELASLKRDRYYLEQKIKSVSLQIDASVEPLRIQTALLASGKPVSDQLIRSGQLYYDISAKEAEKIMNVSPHSAHVLWLDVRTSADYSKQHIPGATLIPVEDLELRYRADIPQTVEKIIVYCAGGDRSRLACDFLSRQGFGNVYYIKDGLQGWAGPTEGNDAGGLIQITSKSKTLGQVDPTLSTSPY